MVVLAADRHRELLRRHPALVWNAHRVLAGRLLRALALLHSRSIEPVERALAHRVCDLLDRGPVWRRGGAGLERGRFSP